MWHVVQPKHQAELVVGQQVVEGLVHVILQARVARLQGGGLGVRPE